jgi:uncharacterized protein (TIGR01244 family)
MEPKSRPVQRAARVASLALALALSACAGIATQKTLPPMAATPSGTAVAQPKPDLYTSGQPAVGDWRAFADAGVRTVVNLRTSAEMKGRDERAEVEAAGMRYLELPIDGAAAIDAEHARALSALLRAQPGPVLLHCASGNRVGGLLALAAAQDGMPAEDALALGRSAGMKSTEGRVREALGVPSEVQTAP